MKKQALPIVLILIVMFIVSCTTLTGTLQKQNENLSRALTRITPTNDPVHGTALVLLPSDVEILKHYFYYGFFLQPSDLELQKNWISYETGNKVASERIMRDYKNSGSQKLLNHHVTIAKKQSPIRGGCDTTYSPLFPLPKWVYNSV